VQEGQIALGENACEGDAGADRDAIEMSPSLSARITRVPPPK
jgi:hypothetical protein